jgi:hypothetical protein
MIFEGDKVVFVSKKSWPWDMVKIHLLMKIQIMDVFRLDGCC